LDFLLDEVMPTLLPLHSLKEKLSQRILSGDMLLEICSVYGEEAFNKEQKLLSFTFSTCEDINWKIRKLGANRLRRIIEKSKKILKERQDVYNNFNEKLEELMTDEENFVKIDAFETIVH
jgi:adenylate kinase family enzyme